MNWIDIEHELPEESEIVLLCIYSKRNKTSMYSLGFLNDKEFNLWTFGNNIDFVDEDSAFIIKRWAKITQPVGVENLSLNHYLT